MEAVLVAVLLLLVVVVANVGVKHDAWRDALEQLRSQPIAEGATRFEVLLWHPRDTERPDALAVLDCGVDRIWLHTRVLTRAGYPLRGAQPDVVELGRGDAVAGALRPIYGQWRLELSFGGGRSLIGDLSRKPARTLAVRDAVLASLGAPRPLLVFGELPSLSWTGASRLWTLAAILTGLTCGFVSLPALAANGLSNRGVLPLIFTPPLFFAAALALGWRARRRRGHVEFHGRGVILIRDCEQAVPWSDLQSFDDGASDAIELRAKRGEKFSLPVWREHERVEALALLDRHGVRRVEE